MAMTAKGLAVGAVLARRGAEKERQRGQGAEPASHADQVRRVHEDGQRAAGVHADGMAGPGHEADADRGENSRFYPPRQPIGARLLPFPEQYQRSHQEEQGMAEQPDRSVLGRSEKAEPRVAAGEAVRASRHHGDLPAEGRHAREQEERGEPAGGRGEAPLPRARRRLVRGAGEEAHDEHAHDEEARAGGQRADGHAERAHRAAALTVNVYVDSTT